MTPDPVITAGFTSVGDLASAYIGDAIPVLIGIALLFFGIRVILRVVRMASRAG